MSKPYRIVGWILLTLLCGVMILAGAGKVFGFAPEEVKKGLEESGLKDQMVLIGIGEIASAILLLLPWTWPIGVLLTSSFWGGAIVSHMTKGDSYLIPSVLLAIAWLGTWLRNPELLHHLSLKSMQE